MEEQFRAYLRSRFDVGPVCGYEIFAGEFAESEVPEDQLDQLIGIAMSRRWIRSVGGMASGLYRIMPAVAAGDPPKITQPRLSALFDVMRERRELPLAELARAVWGNNHPVDLETVRRSVRRLDELLLEKDPRGDHIECRRGIVKLLGGQSGQNNGPPCPGN